MGDYGRRCARPRPLCGLAPLPLLTAINFVNYFDRQIMYGLCIGFTALILLILILVTGYLISIGAYARGTDARLDDAIGAMPAIEAFLRQSVDEAVPAEESDTALLGLAAAV